MPMLDPIYEVMKPKLEPSFMETKVPANIVPILELLQARAVSFHNKADGKNYWEITTQDGRDYCRIEQEAIGDDEEQWTKMVGILLDYAAQKRSQQSV